MGLGGPIHPSHPQDMRVVMGVAAGDSTNERKQQVKAQKMSYAEELKAQMQEQAANKARERNERMGLGPAGQPIGGSQGPPPQPFAPSHGYGSPGGYGPPQNGGYSSQPYPPPPQYEPPHEQQHQHQQQHQQQQQWSRPPPLQPPPPPQYGNNGAPQYLASGYSNGGPASPGGGGGGYSNGPASPNGGGFKSPPGSFQGGVPSIGHQHQSYPSQHQMQQQLQMGGGAPAFGSPGMSGPEAEARMLAKQAKDQYRFELEQQMREKKANKDYERHRSIEEDMRKEREMGRGAGGMLNNGMPAAAGNGMGGGGGGYNPGGGNGMGMRGLPPPSASMMSGPAAAMHMQHQQDMQARLQQQFQVPGPPPPGPYGGSGGGGGGYNGDGGGYGGGSGGAGYGPPQGGLDPYGPPSSGAAPPAIMMGQFRNGNAYMSAEDINTKAAQAKELQAALARQIAEKKYHKEMEKAKLMAEDQREEAKLKAGQELLAAQFAAERNKESGEGKDPKDVVAEAWKKAQDDVAAAKAAKFAGKRGGALNETSGHLGASQEIPPPPARQRSAPHGLGSNGLDGHGPADNGGLAAQRSVGNFGGMPSTPLVAEKVRAVAEAEFQRMKGEMDGESARLREVVAAQSATVAALKAHADRLEAAAEVSGREFAKMRVDMLRRSADAPEHLLSILSDYPLANGLAQQQQHLHQQGGMNSSGYGQEIGVELPPPAAVARRAAAAANSHMFDMGPLIPPVLQPPIDVPGTPSGGSINGTSHHGNGLAQGLQYPPSGTGMRTVNPLEASMAADSVLIYPNGRELVRGGLAPPHTSSNLGQAPHPSPNALVSSSSDRLSSSRPVDPNYPGSNLSTSSHARPPPPAHPPLPGDRISGGGMVAAGRRAGQLSRINSADSGLRSAPPPLADVDTLMHRNADKLAMLKGINGLTGQESAEALEDFLVRFVNTSSAAAPPRGSTPQLRLPSPPTYQQLQQHGSSGGGGGMSSSQYLPPPAAAAAAGGVKKTHPLPGGAPAVPPRRPPPAAGGGKPPASPPPPPPQQQQQVPASRSYSGHQPAEDSLDVEVRRINSSSSTRATTSQNGGVRNSGQLLQQQQRPSMLVDSQYRVAASGLSMTGSIAGESSWVPAN